ncbi:Cobalamin biosynthesis protein CbiB [Vibrio stylophorae]|uniref:Cobalamin biosynthesis protein CbiB n=1 Tax=Vibrio stylophorae TaxID=659351 RepID=A0ABN8DTB9_9VIBR|nr:cobalamin biosynthesis family protein [Vibrio stylophorae]CAH0532647.1 Cobalamin biosynthesis protein CbiB [Vibrio stylophorae]
MTAWHLLEHHLALFTFWGALLFHLLLPLPNTLSPWSIYQRLAKVIAQKVNQPHNSRQQNLISGSMTWALFWFPSLVVLIALSTLVSSPWLLDAALLWLSLGWRPLQQVSQSLIASLAQAHKETSRRILAAKLNRQTESLSENGLGKATAELMILGYGREVVAVLFWYGCFGGIGAAMYRLTLTLARTWSPSRSEFFPFGTASTNILALADLIPLRLFALLCAFGKRGKQAFSGIFRQAKLWFLPGPGWLLCAIAHQYDLSLGGPAIYGDNKRQRPRIGGVRVPSAIELAQLHRQLNWRLLIWLGLQSALFFALHTLI